MSLRKKMVLLAFEELKLLSKKGSTIVTLRVME